MAGPQAGVFLPEAGNFIVGGPIGGSQRHGAAKLVRECDSEAHIVLHAEHSCSIFLSRISLQAFVDSLFRYVEFDCKPLGDNFLRGVRSGIHARFSYLFF
jgi:hypothetical protein